MKTLSIENAVSVCLNTFRQWSSMQPVEKWSTSVSTNKELLVKILLNENSKV